MQKYRFGIGKIYTINLDFFHTFAPDFKQGKIT